MQIEKFRYLIQLAESGSFYAAAKETFLSQQGFSKAISTLESELGCELVVRGPRGVTFTPAGQVALEHAKKIVADYDELNERLLRLATYAENGPRRVRMHMTFYAMKCLDCFDRNLLFSHAQVTECTFSEMMERIDDLEEDEIMVCGATPVMRDRIKSHEGVEFVPMVPARFGIIVHEGSRLAQLDHVEAEDLHDVPCLIPASHELTMLSDWVINTDDLTDVRMRTNNVYLVGDFLGSTPEGFAIGDSLTYYLTQRDPMRAIPNTAFIPLATELADGGLGAIVREGSRNPILSHQVIEWVRNWIVDHNQPYFKTRNVDFRQ